MEGKADRTAKSNQFICPIVRPDKTSLHQGLEKLSEQHLTRLQSSSRNARGGNRG